MSKSTKPAKKAPPRAGVRMSKEVKEGVQRAAKDNARSQASMIEIILRVWLGENGYLAQEKAPFVRTRKTPTSIQEALRDQPPSRRPRLPGR